MKRHTHLYYLKKTLVNLKRKRQHGLWNQCPLSFSNIIEYQKASCQIALCFQTTFISFSSKKASEPQSSLFANSLLVLLTGKQTLSVIITNWGVNSITKATGDTHAVLQLSLGTAVTAFHTSLSVPWTERAHNFCQMSRSWQLQSEEKKHGCLL